MVSIVTPAYNCEHYIEKYIKSVISQTYNDIEIIIVNDGSVDRTEDIIRNYCEKDCRITYIYQENQGASAARNAGVDVAKGTYLLFVDADDYISKNLVEEAVKRAIQDDADVVCFAHYKVYDTKLDSFTFPWDCNQRYSGDFGFQQILNFSIKGYICDKMFRLDKWKKMQLAFENKRYCEDWAPVSEYIGTSSVISFINEPMYYYVQHETSSIHTSNLKVIKDYDHAVNRILSLDCIYKQKMSDVVCFKTITSLEIYHELFNVAKRERVSVYELAKKNGLPSSSVRVCELFKGKTTIRQKIRMICWKLHLYNLLKK